MVNAIKVIIVDDEELARKRIRDMLADRPEFEVAAECADGNEAICAIESMVVDLMFLDIQMPNMDGLSVIEALGADRMPNTIFVTAFDRHAVRAFEVNALDYLLKPFDDDRFETALTRAAKAIRGHESAFVKQSISALFESLRKIVPDGTVNSGYSERLVIKSTGKITFVETKLIDWIQGEGSYVSLHFGTRSELMRTTLNALEKQLNPGMFLRIHRSTIVNVSRIAELRPSFHGEYVVVLKDGRRLKLSRNYRHAAERLIGGAL